MFTIIPVKPFQRTKTRLSPLLSLQQREDLSRYLLERTIKIARQVSEVVIISRDTRVRRVAKAAGAWTLVEAGNGLNPALKQATEWILSRGAEQLLILPNDLPLLTVTDLQGLIAISPPAPSLILTPCQRREGTNALLVRPPNLIPFAFGENSFVRHQQIAREKGVDSLIYPVANLALDIDIPDDLIQAEPFLPFGY